MIATTIPMTSPFFDFFGGAAAAGVYAWGAAGVQVFGRGGIWSGLLPDGFDEDSHQRRGAEEERLCGLLFSAWWA